MKFSWVYLTAKDAKEAEIISLRLVDENLAACVNILGTVDSVYRWKGKVIKDREYALLVKTRKSLIPKLTKIVKALHSYDCPCVVALPIEGGSSDYLKWIAQETRA